VRHGMRRNKIGELIGPFGFVYPNDGKNLTIMRLATLSLMCISSLLLSTITGGAQERSGRLIPDLFTGVRLGSVVMEDGRIVDTQAFNLYHLGAVIAVNSADASNIEVFGNSTYNRDASAKGWMAGVDAEYSGKFAVGASNYAGSTFTRAEDAQAISIGARFIGTNRVAKIDFQQLTPEGFYGYLAAPLRHERSPLSQLANAISELIDLRAERQLTEVLADPAARPILQRLIAAKQAFKENYGVAFVSGVVLGGGAAIEGSFESESDQSSSKWQAGTQIQGGLPMARGNIGASFGLMNEGALRNARFSVTATSLGGEAYSKFAKDYAAQFSGKMGGELWSKDVANTPPTAGLLGSRKPDLPPFTKETPKAVPKLAEKFGTITSEADLLLFDKVVAFDRWNAEKHGQGRWEQFLAEYEKSNTKEKLDEAVEELVLPSDEQSTNLRVRVKGEANQAESRNAPSSSEYTDAQETGFNNRYWSQLQGQYAVVGVEVTRWEDVIPGLGFAESVIAGAEAGIEVIRANRVLNAFDRIINMYSLASNCTEVNEHLSKEFDAYTELFANARIRLNESLATNSRRPQPESPVKLAEDVLAAMPVEARRIYQVFRQHEAIFTAGEVGMGAYYIFQHGESRQRRYLRVSGANDFLRPSEVPRRHSNGHVNWFPTPVDFWILFFRQREQGSGHASFIGRMFSPALDEVSNRAIDLHSPTHYARAIKFFPVLDPEIEEFPTGDRVDPTTGRKIRGYKANVYLMVSRPAPPNGCTNGVISGNPGVIFGQTKLPPAKFPLSMFTLQKTFGRTEIQLTMPSDQQFVLGRRSGHAQFTYGIFDINKIRSAYDGGRINLEQLATYEIMHERFYQDFNPEHGWQARSMRLVPFGAEDLRAVRDWQGFYIYEKLTENQLARFWSALTIKFNAKLAGKNYWSRKFPDARLDLSQPFLPAYLREFTTYVGLTPRPQSWE